MRIVRLNGKRMVSIDAAHRYLKGKLSFPDYYGTNLDALWDVLSTLSESLQVRLSNQDHLLNSLGQYGSDMIRVFKDAERFNHNLHFRIVEPHG
jgi:ribonuclease inhibitor